MTPLPLILSVKEMLVTEMHCPPDWRQVDGHTLDLYVIRDGETVFYVGQSECAFDRVWQHILDGFKGRSVVGRFLLCNWPAAMHYTIELHSSGMACFVPQEHDLNACERWLIEHYRPCFNQALNPHPTPLPARYASPDHPPKNLRHLRRMIHEASYTLKAEARRGWLDEIESEA